MSELTMKYHRLQDFLILIVTFVVIIHIKYKSLITRIKVYQYTGVHQFALALISFNGLTSKFEGRVNYMIFNVSLILCLP